MLTLSFVQEYNDCYRGLLDNDGYICDVLYPKRHPITFRGEKIAFEGVFKLKYDFEDGYFSPSLIVNRRAVRFKIPTTLPYEPTFPYPSLYLCRVNDSLKRAVPLNKPQWDLKAKELFSNTKTCKVVNEVTTIIDDDFFKTRSDDEEGQLWDDWEDDEQ